VPRNILNHSWRIFCTVGFANLLSYVINFLAIWRHIWESLITKFCGCLCTVLLIIYTTRCLYIQLSPVNPNYTVPGSLDIKGRRSHLLLNKRWKLLPSFLCLTNLGTGKVFIVKNPIKSLPLVEDNNKIAEHTSISRYSTLFHAVLRSRSRNFWAGSGSR
jgi:hypothetical protein